jgi:hypothetical protein
VADLPQLLRVALVTICREDVTLQSLCGRVTRILAQQSAFDTLPLPALTYLIVTAGPGGGTRAPWRILVQFTAWADGDVSTAKASELLNAALDAMTPVALWGQGLDVRIGTVTRRDAPIDQQAARRLARADVDVEWFVTG